MDLTSSEMPCKIRKRRFPTTSSSSFANNTLAQLFAENTDSPRNEKCDDKLDRSFEEEDDDKQDVLPKLGSENRLQKSSMNVDRSRNIRVSPHRVSVPEVCLHFNKKTNEVNKRLDRHFYRNKSESYS